MVVTIQKVIYGFTARRTAPGIMVYLTTNTWDDFGFKTLFSLSVENEEGQLFRIGDLKIGYVGQPEDSATRNAINDGIAELPPGFFSLGQDPDYYKRLSDLPESLRVVLLMSLRDAVHDPSLLGTAQQQKVFGTSLLRSLTLNTVQQQFARVLRGGALLTPFHFSYSLAQTDEIAGIELEFNVRPSSKPPTNIHVLIGRNGIGKTTLLNNMISCLVDENADHEKVGNFYDLKQDGAAINNGYFSNVISTSFSAFDPFTPPADRVDLSDSIRYTYIGLKELLDSGNARHKDIRDLTEEFSRSFSACMGLEKKRERWVEAIKCLASDPNFAEMQLDSLPLVTDASEREGIARHFFARKMSSGHAVVLLILTKLVERTEEKTLLLMDEPESHLHPPLLSAFIRALSLLLNDRNAVAIIATHSPVILQEVTKSCVWKLRRTRLELRADRPDEETFGENVGILTRDVFGLEVTKSGFHGLLDKEVQAGKTYDQIVSEFAGQIGFEGKAVLRALLRNRDGVGLP